MRKWLLLICFQVSLPACCTEQEGDRILYEGKDCILVTHWAYPSPLQLYYWQTGETYPFQMISTGNYRGHIACWEIDKNKLYLKKIMNANYPNATSEKGIVTSVELEELFGNDVTRNGVFASWLSGYLLILSNPYSQEYDSDCGKYYVNGYHKYTIIHFEKGIINKKKEYSDEEYGRLMKLIYNHQEENSEGYQILKEYLNYTNSFLKVIAPDIRNKLFGNLPNILLE